MSLLDRITIDPAVCHGRPCVRGLRYPVDMLFDLLSRGMSTAEVLDGFSDLEADDPRALLAYAEEVARTSRTVSLTA